MIQKSFKATLCMVLLIFGLTACSTGQSTDEQAPATPTPIPEEYVLPEDCLLTDEAMQESVESYVDYMNEVIEENGLTLTLNVAEDGSAQIDAVPDENTTAEEIDNIISFDNIKYMFAYLYNNQQVDIEGNILVRAVPDVLTEIEQVRTEAEAKAEKALAQQEENSGGGTDG